MIELSELSHCFAIPDQITFETKDEDLVFIRITNPFATALISMQGAHLISWIPAGQQPVIWLSQDARFNKGKSIRGGVPICWPWFGSHAQEKSFPAHGFARSQPWQIRRTEQLPDDRSLLVFQLQPQAEMHNFWPYPSELELQMIIGDRLEMTLITHNTGSEPIMIGEALHTYFNVSHIDQLSVHGLKNREFIDTLDQNRRKRETDPIRINAEIDRIYVDTIDDCVIQDTGWQRQIRISKQGSGSTVVWNPWIDKSARMGDMGQGGYQKMLCVETTNAADDVVRIMPGEKHVMSVIYQVEELTDL